MKPVVVCLLLIPFSLFGQTLKFEKAFDVYPFGVDPVIKVINSGYLIAGGNTMDAFLMHLNENGDTLWTKFYDSLSDTAQIKGNHDCSEKIRNRGLYKNSFQQVEARQTF